MIKFAYDIRIISLSKSRFLKFGTESLSKIFINIKTMIPRFLSPNTFLEFWVLKISIDIFGKTRNSNLINVSLEDEYYCAVKMIFPLSLEAKDEMYSIQSTI